MHHVVRMAVCAGTLTLTACQGGTIFKSFTLDTGGEPGPSISTDARQRVITNLTTNLGSAPGRVDPRRIVCVEPSPVVAVAVANSVGVGLSALGKGSGSLSTSNAEGLAQLAERTVSVQALLNQGYQACLDYANGAITGTIYSQRTSRLDDLMATLILAENAAGGFGRSGAYIGGKSNSEATASIFSLGKAVGDTAAQQAKLVEAETKVADSQAAVDNPNDGGDAAQEATALKSAKAERAAILSQLQAGSDTMSQSAAEIASVSGVGGIAASPSVGIAEVLGRMQAKFLDKDIDQSYVSTCLAELGRRVRPTGDDLSYVNALMRDASSVLDSNGNIKPAQPLLQQLYYHGRQAVELTLLANHCESNLGELLRVSVRNRHEIEVRKLDIELAKVATVTRHDTAATKEAIHPKADFLRLVETQKVFTKSKADADTAAGTLTAKIGGLQAKPAAGDDPIAAIRSRLTALDVDAKALLPKAVQALATIGTTTQSGGTVENAVNQSEGTYTELITSTMRDGSEAERKVWSLKYTLQQSEAALLKEKLVAQNHEAKELIAKMKLLVQRIGDATTP